MSNLFDSKSSLIALVKESILKENRYYHAQDDNYEKLDKYLNHVYNIYYDIKIENIMKERQIKDDLLLEPMMTEIGDTLKQHDLVQFVTNKNDIPKTYMTHKILNRLATSKGQIYISCSSMIDFELQLMRAKIKYKEIVASFTWIPYISWYIEDKMQVERFVQHYEPDIHLQKVLFYSQSLYSEENIPRIKL